MRWNATRRPMLLMLATVILPAGPGARAAAGYDGETAGWEQCLRGKLERAVRRADDSFDAETGRNLRNYPPDRVADSLHMKLEMRFGDLADMRFTATESLTVQPIGRPASGLTLDAVGLDVRSVEIDDRPVEFFRDDEHVTLRFDPPLPLGAPTTIVFDYLCDHPYDGLFFTPAAPDRPEYTAEVHTQGESITNRHWFIAHDAPNERMTTELIVDVPAGLSVSSNGRLVSSFVNGDRAVWHWLQDKPHVSYLVSLVIGEFDIVEIPHDRVPMKVWVPRGQGDNVARSYGRTGEMIDLFERRFGHPYPWDRYDQLVVKNFGSGGMENTSATTMYPTAVLDETALLDGDLDGLISHELAHQWTGDLLTCKEWAHIWLNEGFATYGEALWAEYRDGEDGYLDDIRGNMRVARRDRTSGLVPMVSPIYEQPDDVFRRRGNPYPKGASILHMLRMMLGDDVFFPGLHLYMNRYAFDVVETSDFRRALEEVSGRDLEWFFDQWCYTPGCPELAVEIDYDGADRALLVQVEQTQQIDARTPAFRFDLPVHVRTASGDRVFVVPVTEKTTSFRAELDAPPAIVAVDPHLHVLCMMDVEKPRSLWLEQLAGGPTIVARHRAIAAIAEEETADSRDRLAAIAGNPTMNRSLRSRAVMGLGAFDSPAANATLVDLLKAGIDDARVRVAVVRAIGEVEGEEVEALLARIAEDDPSYDTRAAAITALGDRKASAHADLIVTLAGTESQHDDVRRAALAALADLDDPRGLDLAMEYARYGYMDRARPAAIRAIEKLAADDDDDRDAAIELLLTILDEPVGRARSSAGSALAEIGDERVLERLTAMASTHPDPALRERAERWAKTLGEKLGDGDGGGRRRGRSPG